MRRRFINTAFFIAVAAATAAGQAFDGTVRGTIYDPAGAVIFNARVVFESGGVSRTVWTNDEGIYMAALPARTYTMTASAPYFCAFREPSLRVAPAAGALLDITLHVAGVANVINLKDGSERDEWVDATTQRPCTVAPRAVEASPEPRALMASTQQRKPSTAKSSTQTAAKPSSGVVNLSTQPGAFVWVDEVRRGAADAEGKLQLKLTPGRHALRVRAKGFAERTLALLPTQRGALKVVLTQTTDEAELAFQGAEEAREKGDNAAAVESYRQALKLRPRFAAAHLGLARALEAQGDTDGALEELKAARRARPVYPESWAVEGRIQRTLADYDASLAAFTRALRESRGFQPEAHTGAGLVYEEQGNYEEAVASFRKALAQLSDTEPVVYELLGRNLEKLERWKEAVAAYEKYLALAPAGAHASAINSIIDQLRKQAAESEQPPPLD